MKNNLAKHIALKTLLKHKHYILNNCADIQRIIESNQFTMIPYRKHANAAPVAELIERLGIKKEIEQNDAFVYINNALKFVFINADVSDEEKCSLLRHELGHILDPNFNLPESMYSRIKKEEFANEFSFYLMNPGIGFRLKLFMLKNWKVLVCILVLIACVLSVSLIRNALPAKRAASVAAPVNSTRIYYVTSAGKKYHRKRCIIVRYRNNLTEIRLSDAIENGYTPCSICYPEEE